ncbi:hypothetical protein LCGC14_2929390, partial [marine sediment metagenome]
MSDLTRIDDVNCVGETDKAIKVLIGLEEIWIPQSWVHDDSEVWGQGDEGTLVLPEWAARK